MPRRAPTPSDAPAPGPWLDHRPGPGEVGTHTWFFVIQGIGMSIFAVVLVWLDVFLVSVGFDTDSLGLNAGFDVGGVLIVLLVGVLLGFMSVLWPIGFLSQAVFSFALAAASRHAPKNATLATLTPALGGRGTTIDPVVLTPLTRRWAWLGSIAWRPNRQLMIGGVLVGIAIAMMSNAYGWMSSVGASVDRPVTWTAAAVCGTIGIAGIIWGVVRRAREMRADTATA